MNKQLLHYAYYILLCCSLISCNEFIRTEVQPSIYINQKSITGFVGDEVQLKASPSNEAYDFKWSSEDPAIAAVSANGLVTLTGEGFTNIVLSAGALQNRVEVSSKTKIALTDIILSDVTLDFFLGDGKNLSFIRVPATANDVPEAEWNSEDPTVVTVNEKGEVASVAPGITNIVVKIGEIIKILPVEVSVTKPFNGPKILNHGEVITIKAADFDFGGKGFAFNDDDANPVGDTGYRRDKGDTQSAGVEIEGYGENLGFVNDGEWFLYTVEAVETDVHYMDFSMSGHSNGIVHVEVNGVNTTGQIHIPAIGSWNNWTTFPSTPFAVNLKKGKNRIKIYIEKAGFNFKSFRMAYL